MVYTLPADMGACSEPAGILSGDQRKVPHVVRTTAKIRTMGFRLTVAAGDSNVGKTKLLLGFLPAGRNRVFLEYSIVDGVGSTVTGALMAGEYTSTDTLRTRVPEHAVSGAITLGTPLTLLSFNEGAAIPGDKESSRPSWGWQYDSLDMVPVWINVGALAVGNEVYGNIVYGQE